MAAKYSGTSTVWPRHLFELYNDVIKRDGVHYTLKAGRTSYEFKNYHYINTPAVSIPKPYYKGYTIRFFLFAGDLKEECYVGVHWSDSYTTWKGRVSVKNDAVTTYEHSYKGKRVGSVKRGDIYTVALRTDDQVYFKMSYNEMGNNTVYMKSITDKDTYQLRANSGKHTILSFHFYNASANPTPVMGDRLFLEEFGVYTGAYATYTVEYTGNSEEVTVNILQFPTYPILKFSFPNNGRLKNKQRFNCIVRTTLHGFSVTMSFDPTPQFQPAGTALNQLQCHFSNCSTINAHIISPL